MPRFSRKIDFASLGIPDLIQARDSRHKPPANLPNVIGTAIELCLIRTDGPSLNDPNAPEPKVRESHTIDKGGIIWYLSSGWDTRAWRHGRNNWFPVHSVLLSSRSGEHKAASSKDIDLVQRIVVALNQAIVLRGYRAHSFPCIPTALLELCHPY